MTTKTLTGTYSAGYVLQAPITTLSIAASGYVEGAGVATSTTATGSYDVINSGRIRADDLSADPGGVYLSDGGEVTNGSADDLTAAIAGYRGVKINNAPGAVTNFGTIAGYARSGVWLNDGGVITNGAVHDTAALIKGGVAAVSMDVAGTVNNFGTITPGVQFIYLATGAVTNGSAADTTAKILGGDEGVYFYKGFGVVTNFGAIEAADGTNSTGVFLGGGGRLTNGGKKDRTALISGYDGVFLGGTARVDNFGTIEATGGLAREVPRGAGVYFAQSGSLTNGAAGNQTALVDGYLGVVVKGVGATVTNFGTIAGTSGVSLKFFGIESVLVVAAGCAFVGAVDGGGGTLDLDTGAGTLTGLLAGGDVTVSGSMAPTTFADFAFVEIGAGATFTTSGAVAIAASQGVIDAGALTLGAGQATIVNAGFIEVTGSGALAVTSGVTGAGDAVISGGTLEFASAVSEAVHFNGKTGVLKLDQSQSYTGTVSGFSTGGGMSLDLADIGFVSTTEATYSNTGKVGVLTVTDGVHTAHIVLVGHFRGANFIAASDGHGGTTVTASAPAGLPPAISSASRHRFIAAMAGLSAVAAHVTVETHAETWRPMLSAPRLSLA